MCVCALIQHTSMLREPFVGLKLKKNMFGSVPFSANYIPFG